MKLIKYTGKRVTISKAGNKRTRQYAMFMCPKCKTEHEKELHNGKRIDTCGSKECQKSRSFRHGYSKTRLYHIWNNVISRCYNPNNKAYKYYGGIGIRTPESWKTFKGFFNDMGFSYTEGLSIDRIDKSKDYSKKNCQWISLGENVGKDKRKLIGKFTLEGDLIIAYNSAIEACEREDIKYSSSITKVARGERKQYKGFVWKYL